MKPLLCVLLGYFCGCFLTADLVAYVRTGRGAGAMGTGNPGMANIAGEMGAKWGAVVLLGDIAKTAVAVVGSYLFYPYQMCALYAGLGAVLGHNFPFWRKFRGGKGVTVTCVAIIAFSPIWGTLSCAIGLAVVLITGWLPLGAVVIPAAFLPFAFGRYGVPAGVVTLILTALMFSRHYRGLGRILRGEEKRHLRGKRRKEQTPHGP